jgi:hypothetical protein
MIMWVKKVRHCRFEDRNVTGGGGGGFTGVTTSFFFLLDFPFFFPFFDFPLPFDRGFFPTARLLFFAILQTNDHAVVI